MEKGKLKREIARTVCIAAAFMAAPFIGSVVSLFLIAAKRYEIIDLKPVVSPVESPAQAAHPLDIPRRFAPEPGNSSASYVDVANPYEFEKFVGGAYWATKNAVDAAGTDRRPNSMDLESIAEQAYPHIMRELNLKKINRPKLTYSLEPIINEDGSENAGEWYFRDNTVVISLSENGAKSLSTAKRVVSHEGAHAQEQASIKDIFWQYYCKCPSPESPQNEVVADLVALEVMAAQALKGDKLAQLGFFGRLNHISSAAKNYAEGKKLSVNDTYRLEEYQAVKEALLGESDTHRGVKLDSTVKLLREMAF